MGKPTLLILAAGMGSRYGGLKQLDSFGPNGETIIDYSLYDAINAGFGKVVFIIRDHFRNDFENVFQSKLEGKIVTEYVSQELNDLPFGYELPPEREKPWGTAHAVLVARHVIEEPFAVINADDYYGPESYKTLANFFKAPENNKNYAVVGYRLSNTLSDFGSVNRGVCYSNDQGNLEKIVETLKIEKADDQGTGIYPDGDNKKTLPPETLVSMNMFGFKPDFFEKTESYFRNFLDDNISVPKSEFFIPLVLDKMINEKYTNIEVLSSDAEWFGVTYKEDKPHVMSKINDLIANGVYPEKLF